MQKNFDITIWSQANCTACDAAKRLLENYNITYKVKTINSLETKQEFFNTFPSLRSVPQIIVDGKHIGGLQELQRFINDNSKTLKVV